MVTYDQIASGAEAMRITRERALRELARHGIDDSADFDAEMGVHATYDAGAVLRFLGY